MAILTSLIPSRPAYLAAAIALAGLCALPGQAQSNPVTFGTYVLSGGEPAGSLGFTTYGDIDFGSINNHGQIAFAADIIGPSGTVRRILSDTASPFINQPTTVVAIGDTVVGAPTGVTYFGFDRPTITDAGNVGFTGRRSDMAFAQGDVNYDGLSLFMTSVSDPGQARVVLTAADETVAALGGESVSSFNELAGPRFDSDGGFNGAFGFGVDFVPGSPGRDEIINSVVVSGDADGISRVIAAPFIDTLPSLPSADVLRTNLVPGYFNTSNPRGEVMFLQEVLTGGALPPELAIFSEAAGSVGDPAILIKQGDPLPQFGSDIVVSYIETNLAVNDAGQHAYIVSYGLSGSSIAEQGFALFSETIGSPGAPGVVHRTGDLIPGTLDNNFDFDITTRNFLEVSAGGHVAIASNTVSPSSSHGLWLQGPEANSELELVYLLRRNGDDILERGYLNDDPFNGPAAPALYEHKLLYLELNAQGQAAFFVNLTTDPLINPVDNLVGGTIYATDLEGNVQIIARTGDLFDVNDDPLLEDFRTLDQVTLNGFNDRSELLFHATFTDGSSGLFVALVPEPSSLALLGLGGLALLRRRR